jgi:large subunit ribosomal protein L35
MKRKTNKAAAKRFKVKKSGKVFRYKAGRRHLLEHKAKDTKRQMRGAVEVDKTDIKKLRDLIPGL